MYFFGEEAELRRREIVSVSVFLLLRVFVLNLYNMCAYYFSCFFLVAVLLFFGKEEREKTAGASLVVKVMVVVKKGFLGFH